MVSAKSQIRPDLAKAHALLGVVVGRHQHRSEEAKALFIKAISLDPILDDPYKHLSSYIIQDRSFEEALDNLRRVLPSHSDLTKTYDGLQSALIDQGRYLEARRCNEELLRRCPDSARAIRNLGMIAMDLQDMDTAISYFHQTLQMIPDSSRAIMEYIHAWLMTGNYQRAWYEFKTRQSVLRNRPIPNRYRNARWSGEPVRGKTLILHAEGGYGDAVQFVRFARTLKEEGAQVTVKCRSPLITLLQTADGVDSVIPITADSPPADFECEADWVFMYRQSFGTVPYLRPAPQRAWQHNNNSAYHGAVLNVGLVWRGRDVSLSNPYKCRSLSLSSFRPFASIGNVRVISLQHRAGSEELAEQPLPLSAEPWENELQDFHVLAGVIAELDMVISVDTSTAHVAGALNRPTWILLPFTPMDWRWHLGREDSPWYKSVRLFRQRQPGAWDGLIREVADSLTHYMMTRVPVEG